MLVIVMKNQLLSPAAVCKDCPMASQSGLPRWQKGRLRCARPVPCTTDKATSENLSAPKPCTQYECAMGFRVAELSEQSV